MPATAPWCRGLAADSFWLLVYYLMPDAVANELVVWFWKGIASSYNRIMS